MTGELLIAADIAARHQVARSTVVKWIRDPSFPASADTVSRSGRLRPAWDAIAVDKWLEERGGVNRASQDLSYRRDRRS